MVAAGAAAIGVIQMGFRERWKLAAGLVAVWLGLSVLGAGALPAVVQRLRVTPNEINTERPYIERNIAFTRAAYNVNDVEERDFAAEESLTPELLGVPMPNYRRFAPTMTSTMSISTATRSAASIVRSCCRHANSTTRHCRAEPG